jgi:hypothetical protein
MPTVSPYEIIEKPGEGGDAARRPTLGVFRGFGAGRLPIGRRLATCPAKNRRGA